MLLVIASAAVAGSPAFATPRLTSSTGTAARPDNSAVSPFATPLGSTTSSSTFLSTDMTLTIGASVWACSPAHMSGYIGLTHTELRITSVTFGDGSGRGCSGIGGGSISGTATSPNPWHLHFRTIEVSTSATGTLNLSSNVTFVLNVFNCHITWPPQSVRITQTSTTTSLTMDDGTVRSTGSGFCPSGTARITAIYTARPDTTRDARLRVTSLSSQ
jgi:hypothetical protein